MFLQGIACNFSSACRSTCCAHNSNMLQSKRLPHWNAWSAEGTRVLQQARLFSLRRNLMLVGDLPYVGQGDVIQHLKSPPDSEMKPSAKIEEALFYQSGMNCWNVLSFRHRIPSNLPVSNSLSMSKFELLQS